MKTTGDDPREADRNGPVPENAATPGRMNPSGGMAEGDAHGDPLQTGAPRPNGKHRGTAGSSEEPGDRETAANRGRSRRKRRRRSGGAQAERIAVDPARSTPIETTAETKVEQSAATTPPSGPANANGRADEPAPPPGQDKDKRSAPETAERSDAAPRGGRSKRSWPNNRGRSQSRRYAALDLGTNNCRLLVAEPQFRGFRIVDAFSRIIRLGEGLGHSGRLSEAAMDRTVEALRVCARKLRDGGVDRARLIATEACRAAENGQDFLDRVDEETGLTLEIVDRATEARLAVAGCATLVDPDADGVVLFDIGGGSSEIVWLDLTMRSQPRVGALVNCIRSWTSLPVGVVNLSERHGGVHVDEAVFESMIADVGGMLEQLPEAEALRNSIHAGNFHMLGTSGTVTTLAGVHLELERYDRRRVDGAWLEAADVEAMIGRLLEMEFEQRVANPCIGRDRADLVMAGCAILEAMRRRWPCERLRVADRGLREGILVELMVADGVWSRRRRRRGYRGDRPRSRASRPPGHGDG